MNWLQKITQVWRAPDVPPNGQYGDQWVSKIIELYRLSYLYYGVEDRIRETPDMYMKRFENILNNLRERVVEIGQQVKSDLVYTFDNWLRQHALLDPRLWAQERLNSIVEVMEDYGDEDDSDLSGLIEQAAGEYESLVAGPRPMFYQKTKATNEEHEVYFALAENLSLFPAFKAYFQETMGLEDYETMVEIYGMPEGADQEDFVEQLFAGDGWLDLEPFEHLGLSEGLQQFKTLPSKVQSEMALFIYEQMVFPAWYNKWSKEGIDQTRATVERNYKMMMSADPSNVGEFLAAVNIGLHTMHQNGSMLDYLSVDHAIDDQELGQELARLSNGEYEEDWKAELESLFTPEAVPSPQMQPVNRAASTWLQSVAYDVGSFD